jgi:hypothetical protein
MRSKEEKKTPRIIQGDMHGLDCWGDALDVEVNYTLV